MRIIVPALLALLVVGCASNDPDRIDREARRQLRESIQGLSSEDPIERAEAAHQMGMAGDRRAVPVLIIALDDPHMDVFAASAVALGRLSARIAVPKLISYMDDARVNPKDKTYRALRRLRPRDDREYPELPDIARSWAAYALGELCDPADEVATDALKKLAGEESRKYRGGSFTAGEESYRRSAECCKNALQKIRMRPIVRSLADRRPIPATEGPGDEKAKGTLHYEAACEKLAADLCAGVKDKNGIRLAAIGLEMKGSKIAKKSNDFTSLILSNTEIGIQRYSGGSVTLVERGKLAAVVKELEKQHAGLYDRSSQQKVGRLSGANTVLVGDIFMLPGFFDVKASLVDVETGRILRKSTVKIERSPELEPMLWQ